MIARGLILAGLFGTIFLGAQAAWAQEELKNDGFTDGQSAGFQSGFLKGEIGASRFTPSATNVALLKLQFMFGGMLDGTKKDLTIRVWDDATMEVDPGPELFGGTYNFTSADMALQEIDLSAQNIFVTSTFRVGIEFPYDGLPSIARDSDDTIAADKNFIKANGIGWKPSADLGVTGDWIIRAFVSEGMGGQGGAGGSGGTTGTGTTTTSTTSTSTSDTGGAGGAGGGSGGGDGGAGGGCGCRAAGSDPGESGALFAGLVAAIAIGARRRRTRLARARLLPSTACLVAGITACSGAGGDTSAQGGSNAGGSATGGTGQGGQSTGGTSQGGQSTGGSGGAPNDGSGVFEAPNAWTKNVGDLDKSPDSDAIIAWLDQNGGWGGGDMQIDFSIHVMEADSSTPKQDFQPTGDFYDPDCDQVAFPVPPNGAIEGEDGYECTTDGDCHLIVVHKDEKKLYEMWRANIVGGTFYGGCAALWDLTKTYPDNLRGEGCTSADAAGFPIRAMLPTSDEVKAGAVNHAIRFILPNARLRHLVYVHPATHSTFATSGDGDAPPYGVRFRLRKDFPLDSLPSDGARVLAKGLQTYGMFMSDGGTVALTFASDRFSQVTWDSVGVDEQSLSAIQVTDMEVVDMGAPITWSGDCFRN